ncbi:MAG: tetratricopeptide repeat protein [Cyanobacteriota bacterium]|nr:tetratricopeptide repeat protein [Cyanobacteriota bacterium]
MKNIPENLRMMFKEAKDLVETRDNGKIQIARDKLLDQPEGAKYPIYHYLLARIAKELNQEDAALSHLEKSLELDPNNPMALLKVGESKLKKGKADEGRQLLLNAIPLVDSNPNNACKLCLLLVKAGEIDKAAELINLTYAKNPNDADVRYTQALALKAKGETSQYEQICLEAIRSSKLDASLKQRVNLAKHHIKVNKPGQAIDLIMPLLDLPESEMPNNKMADLLITILSYCQLSNGNLEQSRKMLTSVQVQNSLPTNYVWCSLQLREGNLDAASKSARAIKDKAVELHTKVAISRTNSSVSLSSGEVPGKSSQKKEERIDHVERLASADPGQSQDDLTTFLGLAHNVFLDMIPT